MKLVTIFVLVYNPVAQWLEECLDSVSKQTVLEKCHICVIDDCSDDDSHIALIENCAMKCEIVQHKKNFGLSAVRNRAALRCRTPWLYFLDYDDMIEPTCIESLLKIYSNTKTPEQYAFVYSATLNSFPQTPEKNYIDRFFFDAKKLTKVNFLTSAALIKTDLFISVGGNDERNHQIFEDWEFWARLTAFGYKGIFLDEPLFVYRRHASGNSTILQKKGATVETKTLIAKFSQDETFLLQRIGRLKSLLFAEKTEMLNLLKSNYPTDERKKGATWLDQTHLVLKRMLTVFDMICKHYEIEYFLIGGTLLGAYRHRGFIPWDGDVDVGMTVLNLRKFEAIIAQALPVDMFFQSNATDPFFHLPYECVKLRDRCSNYVEYEKKAGRVAWHNGIQLDIFIYHQKNGKWISTGTNDILDCELYPLSTLPFENLLLPVPNQTENYLRRFYDKDLSEPPVEKRYPHEGQTTPCEPCDHPESLDFKTLL